MSAVALELPLGAVEACSPTLAELRALRDGYGRRAAVFLSRQFRMAHLAAWCDYVEQCKVDPHGQADGILLLNEEFARAGMLMEWSHVERFIILASRVWEMETASFAGTFRQGGGSV